MLVDKLTSYDDKNWTDSLTQKIISETFGEKITKEVESATLIDFLRPPVVDEQTGVIEANPSYYESSVDLQMVKTSRTRRWRCSTRRPRP